MKNAVVVDADYGSVTRDDLNKLQGDLAKEGITLSLHHCTDEAQIISASEHARVMICTGNPPVTRKVMTALPELQVVIRLGIGVNSVDLDAATKLGKVVLNMPGFCINELAVHAAALALALDRNIVYYDRRIRKGQWPKATYYMPRSPRDMVLGLYGFGGSAKELYKIFHDGFGSKVITCDPYAQKEDFDVTFVDFDTLLEQSDILSVHAPLNAETHHIFGREAFEKMKSNAAIINVARGGLIDQEALADALDAGQIRFAGLDVFEQEPLPVNSRLLERDDVVLTCHSAFYGEESKARQLAWAFELTVAALNRHTLDTRKVANRGILNEPTNFRFI